MVRSAVLLLLTTSTAACAAGPDAETYRIAPDNANADIGDLELRDVRLVAGPGGSGSATLAAYILNPGAEPDTLTAVSLAGAGSAPAGGGGAGITLPPGEPVLVGAPGQPEVQVSGNVSPGTYELVTFTFARAGRGTVNASVVSAASPSPGGGVASQTPGSPSPTAGTTSGASPSLAPGGGAPTAERSALPTETASGVASPAARSRQP
ncbi:hypothetical protein HS99_0021300 [Kitasatospora aureofaciens]|uniref:Lipoprotein n=1 Tax=Kitasatospora aureofaciens TaxID=1894 RepID=A0A1E7NCR9_KITAU|nr:hypothetical protein B6264_27755 [Kitasatospora aureofaciens]OEV38444.1 hypothetical protein HS99_0021300 [Kitasatospora aureofaciens]QEU98580.1 hypothetical protein CP971_03950 [Streptomyces viridifaciens]